MSKKDDKRRRAKYTLEFKLEAVRLVKGGQDASVTAQGAGHPEGQTLGNWVRLSEKGELHGAGRQAGERRADGAGAAAGRAGAGEDGARHPKKSDGVLCEGIAVKYAWIAKHKAVWPVTLMCEVLGVSASGYFEHRRRNGKTPAQPGPGASRLSNEALLAHIRAIHAEVKGEYGWPRVWKELLARGMRVGKDRVQRLMQLHGIKARGKRKFVVTTDSKHDLPMRREPAGSATSRPRRPTACGAATSPTSPPTRAGCTWPR